MKTTFITSLFLLINLFAFTQEYTESTVILNSSDTLKGLIRISLENNHTFLNYKKDIDSKDTVYHPDVIKKIIYPNGELFETYSFVEGGIVLYDFFRCIIQGEVTLYSRFDSQLQEHLYFKFNDEPLRELIEKKEIIDMQEKSYPLYYRVLGSAYFKCPKLLDKNNLIALNEKSIAKSVIDYHKCINKPYTTYYPAKKEKGSNPFQYGVYYGRVFGSNEYFGEKDYYSHRTESSVFNGGYNLGCFINLFLPKSKQSKSFQFELVFVDYSFKTWERFDVNYTSGDRITFSKKYIQFKAVFKQHIWMKNNGLFLGLGAQLISMPQDNKYKYVKPRSYAHPVVGYTYNFGKFRLFADFRYDVFFDKTFTANVGVAFNSKK